MRRGHAISSGTHVMMVDGSARYELYDNLRIPMLPSRVDIDDLLTINNVLGNHPVRTGPGSARRRFVSGHAGTVLFHLLFAYRTSSLTRNTGLFACMKLPATWHRRDP